MSDHDPVSSARIRIITFDVKRSVAYQILFSAKCCPTQTISRSTGVSADSSLVRESLIGEARKRTLTSTTEPERRGPVRFKGQIFIQMTLRVKGKGLRVYFRVVFDGTCRGAMCSTTTP